MTIYKSEELTPNLLDIKSKEFEKISRILEIDQALSKLYEERNQLFSELPKMTPMVAKVLQEGVIEPRTFIVGNPTGHYIIYKELDFLMNAKTTKKDLKEVGLE